MESRRQIATANPTWSVSTLEQGQGREQPGPLGERETAYNKVCTKSQK